MKTAEEEKIEQNDETETLQPKSKKKQQSAFKRYFPWCICATSFCVQFFVLGFYKSFGPVYVQLLEDEPEGLGGGPVATSWVASLSICTSYLSTPISFEVIRRIKFRSSMLLGACLSGIGLLISAYADSVYVLYVTFGLLFGIGSSLCYSASLLILPQYFSKNWSLAHGIALAGNGLGGMGLSPANGKLLASVGFRNGFKIMAAVSFSVLFTCGLIYQTPPEKNPEEEDEEEDEEENNENLEGEEKEETAETEVTLADELKAVDEEIYRHPTIWKNKPLLIFLLSTYLLNFGYYVPYVHLVKLSIDVGVSKDNANLLPGLLSLAQSVGKVFIGKVFSYGSVNRILAYQLSLIALSIATTFVPVLKTFPLLIAYAVAFGFSDGCGQATNMIIIGDLAGKELLPKAYSTFLVCSASAFVVGPPIAGAVYSATGEYSIAFFMCGAMAFSSALLLFVVTCMRDEEQFAYKRRRKEEVKEERKKKEEQKKLDKERGKDSGIDLTATDNNGNKSGKERQGEVPYIGKSRDRLHYRGGAARNASFKKSQDFNKAMLTRSWHSIDFKPRKAVTKSRESVRSRASNKNHELKEIRTIKE